MYWTPMTRKIFLSGTPLLLRGYGVGRTLAWYVTRRLHQA
jgi:hypothetical protein